MPTYSITSATAKVFPGYGLVQPDGDPIVTNVFYYPIPVGFELTDYGDAPWVTEHADVIGSGISLDELVKYKAIEITNASGAVIECVANEKTAHPKAIPDGVIYVLNLENDIWTLDIDGDGTGNVYVTGILK